MWTYDQTSGQLKHGDALIATGYSGNAIGKNNSAMQGVPDIGPIPRGLWTIGPVIEKSTLGPHVMALTPSATTTTFGRSGFYCHGDSIADPGHGSCGCIIMDPYTRGRLAETSDRFLQVL